MSVEKLSDDLSVDHKVSRLPPLTIRPIQTCFRFGSAPLGLNLANEE